MADRRTQGRLGLVLMATALVGAVVAATPAAAQDGGQDEVDTPVQAHALLAYPVNDVVPDTAFSGVPPQVVCVVEPQACPESLEPVREPIAGALSEVDRNQQTSPLQPTQPDALTIAYVGGAPRYASAVQVKLPTVPAGEQFDQFVLRVPQGQPSFSYDSPAFRRVVLGAIQAAGGQDPEAFQEQLARALEEEEPLAEPVLGIEACPLTVPVPEDAEPPQSRPVSSVSQENADGGAEAAVDCLYGANGTFDEKTQSWSFDLTFAAQAWADGTLDDNGVLLRPTGAPNLAFGDPDTSTNAQVVLDIARAPTATFSTSTPPPPPAPLAPAPALGDTTGTAPSTAAPSSTSSFSSPPSGPVDGGSVSMDTPAAEVAPPQTAPSAGQEPTVALDATPATSPGSWPWSWLLLPVFAAGAWLTARSLTAEVVVTGARRGGALSRLVDGT